MPFLSHPCDDFKNVISGNILSNIMMKFNEACKHKDNIKNEIEKVV